MSHSVAILGATGLVGRTALTVLEERRFPVRTLKLLASDREDRGERSLPFRGEAVRVEPVSPEAFAQVDLALFTCANEISQAWAEVARSAGARVVDNSSAFRYFEDVPLIVPEVNADRLSASSTLVANPNCSTIAIVMALAPLARDVGIERVHVATYQSASGGGSDTLEAMEQGIRAGLDGDPPRRADGTPALAFNVVPRIDRFEDNGYTREEMKVVWESRKILGIPDLAISATAVRVPVRVGHGAAVSVLLHSAITPDAARALWKACPGIELMDDPGADRYPTPLDVAGRDTVLIGRVRRDLTNARGLLFFVVSDNLRKGAATNAVQIAERLAELLEASTAGRR
ncbi:MAG TPA: aspartate-semialdehyde dehydrogenase [Candidatus Eisenbacteria bacterium]|nr:aspartate-semialdehyde dehydrogenase [Candidatus Eisenbacteria bacterium]